MRVILKPAGLLLVAIAFSTLIGAVAYQRVSSHKSHLADAELEKMSSTLSQRLRTAPPRAVVALPALILENPGFEGGFERIAERRPGQGVATTHRGGEVAFPWRDDSDWADVSVAYAKDTTNPHSGKSCQRVMVQAVRSGAVQMVQVVQPAKGKTYTVSCWFKSDRPLDVEIGLRREGSPFTYYATQKATIKTEWQQVTLNAAVTERHKAMFIIKLMGPANLLLDDAAITVAETPDASDATQNQKANP